MSMRTLNSWIIFVDEVRLNKLDCEAGLADTAAADHDELVLSSKLSNQKRDVSNQFINPNKIIAVEARCSPSQQN